MRHSVTELQKQLASHSRSAQAFFALLCSERARSCCWTFQRDCGRDFSAYFDACDALFSCVVHPSEQHRHKLTSVALSLEHVIPSSQEFGTAIACQGRNAMIAMLYAADIYTGMGADDGTDAASAATEIVDALNSYYLYAQSVFTGSHTTVPETFPLLDRELLREAEDLEFLKAIGEAGPELLAARRVANLQFAVPVAAW